MTTITVTPTVHTTPPRRPAYIIQYHPRGKTVTSAIDGSDMRTQLRHEILSVVPPLMIGPRPQPGIPTECHAVNRVQTNVEYTGFVKDSITVDVWEWSDGWWCVSPRLVGWRETLQ